MRETCIVCFEAVANHQTWEDWFFHRDCICGKCRAMFVSVGYTVEMQGLFIYILYHYQEELENLLFQYKDGRDVALAPIFFYHDIQQLLKRYQGYTLVGMPSSIDKIKERGFAHLPNMLKGLSMPYCDLFEKDENYKQSLQHALQRKNIVDHMRKRKDVEIPNTPILLVDDVCTTGSTLACAYHLLRGHTMKVEALVLCAHDQFLKAYPQVHRQRKFIKRKEKSK